jgi:hypothetical protein
MHSAMTLDAGGRVGLIRRRFSGAVVVATSITHVGGPVTSGRGQMPRPTGDDFRPVQASRYRPTRGVRPAGSWRRAATAPERSATWT